MQKTTNKLCSTCKYGRMTSTTTYVMCDYLLITGKRRGCKVGECNKYEKGSKKRKFIW